MRHALRLVEFGLGGGRKLGIQNVFHLLCQDFGLCQDFLPYQDFVLYQDFVRRR